MTFEYIGFVDRLLFVPGCENHLCQVNDLIVDIRICDFEVKKAFDLEKIGALKISVRPVGTSPSWI